MKQMTTPKLCQDLALGTYKHAVESQSDFSRVKLERKQFSCTSLLWDSIIGVWSCKASSTLLCGPPIPLKSSQGAEGTRGQAGLDPEGAGSHMWAWAGLSQPSLNTREIQGCGIVWKMLHDWGMFVTVKFRLSLSLILLRLSWQYSSSLVTQGSLLQPPSWKWHQKNEFSCFSLALLSEDTSEKCAQITSYNSQMHFMICSSSPANRKNNTTTQPPQQPLTGLWYYLIFDTDVSVKTHYAKIKCMFCTVSSALRKKCCWRHDPYQYSN